MESANKYRELWRVMFYLADYLRDSTAELNETELVDMFKDLTYRQGKVFRNIMYMTEDKKEGVSLKEVSQNLGISPAAASEMVDVLVQKGIFTRVRSVEDRRSIRITISEKMERELEKIDIFMTEKIKAMTDSFSEKELDVLIEYLKIMKEKNKRKEAK